MTTYGYQIDGFEKNENVEEIYSSSTESIYRVINPFMVEDSYKLEEGWYFYECHAFNRCYTNLDELSFCEMADVSIEAKKALDLPLSLRDLAKLVDERERDLAPGSETSLLAIFVNEYDYVSKILYYETSLDLDKDITDTYKAWEKAYNRMEKFESEGVDYSIDMLF